ncbi:MAG: CPBP family intramembrane metalloprotease [Deltaproteobacteria bacterium]|nr:CPBP family intramembrane metalloprotease [Deltaproteobacteria bacterium]
MTRFLLVAFGSSWAIAALLYLLGPEVPVLLRTALLVVFMFGPALGAVVAQRQSGAAVLQPLAARLKPNRWWLLAWLLPLALQPLVFGVALLHPEVTLSLDFSGLYERLAAQLPAEQLAESRAELEKIPPALLALAMTVQPLFAGATINALAAFGEELGWRGWLFRHFEALGFWRRSALVGALWGLWHAPIILQGHNYPQHPVLGVAMMVVFCVLLAPLHELVRLRGESVWAAAVLHGSVNASAGVSLLYLRGGDDLWVGFTGGAGLIVLAVAAATIYVVDKASGGALLSTRNA